MLNIQVDDSLSISETPFWLALQLYPDEFSCCGWMYTADTKEELIQVITSSFEHDKHLVGY